VNECATVTDMENISRNYIPITYGRTADDKTSTLVRHIRDEGRATRTACGRVMNMDVIDGDHYVKVSVPCEKCYG